MAAFNKYNVFAQDILTAKHNFTSHVFKVALSNTLTTSADTVLANTTQIAATGGYVAGGYTLDGVTLTQSGGVAKVVITDEVITATGGNVGPFQYLVVYNSTTAGGPLVGWVNYGAALTLIDGDSLTLDFDGVNGVFDIT